MTRSLSRCGCGKVALPVGSVLASSACSYGADGDTRCTPAPSIGRPSLSVTLTCSPGASAAADEGGAAEGVSEDAVIVSSLSSAGMSARPIARIPSGTSSIIATTRMMAIRVATVRPPPEGSVGGARGGERDGVARGGDGGTTR